MSENSRIITWEELGEKITPNNCWILVEGIVYNVSDFIVEHPGGDEPLLKNAGLDATQAFQNINHSEYAVSLRNARKIGCIQDRPCPDNHEQKVIDRKAEYNKQKKAEYQATRKKNLQNNGVKNNLEFTLQNLKSHNSEDDCWIAIEGKVINVTSYLNDHPGGMSLIMEQAGKDATAAFREAGHSLQAINKKDSMAIGDLKKNMNLSYLLVILILAAVGAWFMLK